MTDDACDLLCLDLPRAEARRQGRPSAPELSAASEAARALSDPTSLAVAVARERYVRDLAWVSERSDKLVSHHVRQSRAAGLVRSRWDGTVMYGLSDRGLALRRSSFRRGTR